jgi:hypothetical protein
VIASRWTSVSVSSARRTRTESSLVTVSDDVVRQALPDRGVAPVALLRVTRPRHPVDRAPVHDRVSIHASTEPRDASYRADCQISR